MSAFYIGCYGCCRPGEQVQHIVSIAVSGICPGSRLQKDVSHQKMTVAHRFEQGGCVLAGSRHPGTFGQKHFSHFGKYRIVGTRFILGQKAQRRIAFVIFLVDIRTSFQKDGYGYLVRKATRCMKRRIVVVIFIQTVKRDILVSFVQFIRICIVISVQIVESFICLHLYHDF